MIVVTGGAGFIGSCFIASLNERGIDDILVVDEFERTEKWKNLLGKRFLDVEHKDTFRNKLLIGDYGAKIEAIVHLGACSTTTETNADYLLENNYNYSKDLALYSVDRNVRFIYASSAATYGDGSLGYDDYSVSELRPLNMYGYSKLLFDNWVLRNGFDSKFVGVRFFNVFGPNEYHKGDMASMVWRAFRQIRDNGVIRLFQSHRPDFAHGEQKRDFIYVKDCTEVLWRMLNYGEIRGIYNLGTGKARSWNDLAKAVFAALNKEVNIEYIPMPENLRPQYQYHTEAKLDKLSQTRALVDFTSLESAISDYVTNYLVNNRLYW